jgi:prepilin-type N-terminal cleavage/methylation domain-containing protein
MIDFFGQARFVRRRICRRGFTLVELLAVITIIGILSSIFLLALSRATQTAKAARTRALISKIHNMMMARWDAYRTIRLPIVAEAKGSTADAALYNASNDQTRYRQNVARRRMFAMRELLRMEMPDRYEDLTTFQPTVLVLPGSTTPVRPYLWSVYRRRMASAKNASPITKGLNDNQFLDYIGREYQSAECLYLILTSGIDDSSVATEHFAPSDIGDKDKDGMPEFRDAWGAPVEFLRWAPGYTSPMQPVYRYSLSSDPDQLYLKFNSKQYSDPKYLDPEDADKLVSRWQLKKIQVLETNVTALSGSAWVNKNVVIDQDDPFNPLRVGPVADNVNPNAWQTSSRWIPGNQPPEHGFLLIPLIYSCGLDSTSGINHYYGAEIASAPSQDKLNGNVYLSDPYAVYVDATTPSNTLFRGYRGCSQGLGYDFDNITNQQTEANNW